MIFILFLFQLNFVVNPGKPTKLIPLESPGTPTVSNTRNPQSRTLIRSTKFQLVVSLFFYYIYITPVNNLHLDARKKSMVYKYLQWTN